MPQSKGLVGITRTSAASTIRRISSGNHTQIVAVAIYGDETRAESADAE